MSGWGAAWQKGARDCSDPGMSQRCALAAEGATCILGGVKPSVANCSKEVILLLYLALVWHYFVCCVWFWALQYEKDIMVLESVVAPCRSPRR